MVKRYRVTELLSCDYIDYFPGAEEHMERGRRIHEKIQGELLQMLNPEFVEVEKEISYRFEAGGVEYEIVGHVDVLETNPVANNYRIFEIKPYRPKLPEVWVHQVLFYETILRETTGVNYWSYFVLYDKSGEIRDIRPLRTGSVDHDKLIKQLVLLRRKYGRIKVASTLCNYCTLKNVCDKPVKLPPVMYKYRTLIIEKYKGVPGMRRATPHTVERAEGAKHKNRAGLEKYM